MKNNQKTTQKKTLIFQNKIQEEQIRHISQSLQTNNNHEKKSFRSKSFIEKQQSNQFFFADKSTIHKYIDRNLGQINLISINFFKQKKSMMFENLPPLIRIIHFLYYKRMILTFRKIKQQIDFDLNISEAIISTSLRTSRMNIQGQMNQVFQCIQSAIQDLQSFFKIKQQNNKVCCFIHIKICTEMDKNTKKKKPIYYRLNLHGQNFLRVEQKIYKRFGMQKLKKNQQNLVKRNQLFEKLNKIIRRNFKEAFQKIKIKKQYNLRSLFLRIQILQRKNDLFKEQTNRLLLHKKECYCFKTSLIDYNFTQDELIKTSQQNTQKFFQIKKEYNQTTRNIKIMNKNRKKQIQNFKTKPFYQYQLQYKNQNKYRNKFHKQKQDKILTYSRICLVPQTTFRVYQVFNDQPVLHYNRLKEDEFFRGQISRNQYGLEKIISGKLFKQKKSSNNFSSNQKQQRVKRSSEKRFSNSKIIKTNKSDSYNITIISNDELKKMMDQQSYIKKSKIIQILPHQQTIYKTPKQERMQSKLYSKK